MKNVIFKWMVIGLVVGILTSAAMLKYFNFVAPNPEWKCFLDVLEYMESGGYNKAVGPAGEIGCLQLTKIYVDDVNRILGKRRFKYTDRRNKYKSREMVRIYLQHYSKGLSFKDKARIHHNGDPNGHLKESTREFGERVVDMMSKWKEDKQ